MARVKQSSEERQVLAPSRCTTSSRLSTLERSTLVDRVRSCLTWPIQASARLRFIPSRRGVPTRRYTTPSKCFLTYQPHQSPSTLFPCTFPCSDSLAPIAFALPLDLMPRHPRSSTRRLDTARGVCNIASSKDADQLENNTVRPSL